MAKKLNKVEITIEVKVGDEEKMFGSITNKDIHKELLNKGFELEKNQVKIKDPIKTLGIYHVQVKVSKDNIEAVIDEIKSDKKLAQISKKPNKLKSKVKEVLKNFD